MKNSLLRLSRRLRVEALEDRTVPTAMPLMVSDINAVPTISTSPTNITAVGTTAYFVMNDGTSGNELWKSDGTAAGTVLVKDINPGGANSNPENLTNFNGTLYFTADDGTHGWELWKSDGTAAGTVLVKDINPGSASSYPGGRQDSGHTSGFSNLNGKLFFGAYNGNGSGLWTSDGTTAGTTEVKHIYFGTNYTSSNSLIGDVTNVNGTLFFSAYEDIHNDELWKSDGTAAGTVLVKDIVISGPNPGSYPRYITNVNGTAFFVANEPMNHVDELWKSDGTEAGTVLVRDFNPGGASFFPSTKNLTVVNGTLFFNAQDDVNNFTHGYEVWKSDGTTAGTVLVKDINPIGGSYPHDLTNLNGTLYFGADDGTHGAELWQSDGTEAGTVQVADINPGSAGSGALDLANVNGTLYFQANDGTHGAELWRSDGTPAGTGLVADINPGSGGSGTYGFLADLANVGGTLFLPANDGIHGNELWKSDGTAAGTALVKDIFLFTASSNPANVTDIDGTLYFSAGDGMHGTEPWRSDGTAAGTILIRDIRTPNGTIIPPNYCSSFPEYFTNVNGRAFFAADDGINGTELWTSDGTTAGTVMVKDIYPGSYSGYGGSYPYSSSPNNLTNVNGTLYFVASSPSNGRELWKSDGTAAGTVMVADICPGNAGSSPLNLTNVNGTLYFEANDGTHGFELWKSDGTAAGTLIVEDIRTCRRKNYTPNLTNLNGTLYFTASNSMNGNELWKSDGTAAGSVMVADIRPGSGSSNPSILTNVGGTLFFTADDGLHGSELWKSDGTAAGTVLINDINVGNTGSNPADLTNVNGTLLFTADDGTHGREVWKSDGSPAGTVIVRDIAPGNTTSRPSSLTSANGKLYFSATDGKHGQELWRSDGTVDGTVMVADINPGSADSLVGGTNAGNMAVINGSLYFAADDGVHGRELWVLPPDLAPTVSSVRVNDGSAQRSRITSLTVTFSMQVSFATTPGAAFTLTRVSDNVAVGFSATASVVGGVTVVTLNSFIGSATEFGSLADGRYTLTALASQISANGQQMANNYIFGDAQGLFRMFGDVNGDRTVNGLDLGFFRNAFGSQSGEVNYLSYFDFDGDGVINGFDLGQFRTRFGTMLP